MSDWVYQGFLWFCGKSQRGTFVIIRNRDTFQIHTFIVGWAPGDAIMETKKKASKPKYMHIECERIGYLWSIKKCGKVLG